jgi:hypothetical protein
MIQQNVAQCRSTNTFVFGENIGIQGHIAKEDLGFKFMGCTVMHKADQQTNCSRPQSAGS